MVDRRRDLMTDWMQCLDPERGQMAAAAAVTATLQPRPLVRVGEPSRLLLNGVVSTRGTCRAQPRPIDRSHTRVVLPSFGQPFVSPARAKLIDAALRCNEHATEGMGWRTEQAVQRHIADHGGHVVELDGTIRMILSWK